MGVVADTEMVPRQMAQGTLRRERGVQMDRVDGMLNLAD